MNKKGEDLNLSNIILSLPLTTSGDEPKHSFKRLCPWFCPGWKLKEKFCFDFKRLEAALSACFFKSDFQSNLFCKFREK